jgi:hypothetical protein
MITDTKMDSQLYREKADGRKNGRTNIQDKLTEERQTNVRSVWKKTNGRRKLRKVDRQSEGRTDKNSDGRTDGQK